MFIFRTWKSTVALALLALGVLVSRPAQADGDSFWGRDKALHFVVAGSIAGVGYGMVTVFTEDRWKALALGGGAAIAAGALKEGLDATGFGDPSWKDFAWDLIGAACGLGVAWAVDVGVHGGRVPPLSSSVTATPHAAMAIVRASF